MQSIQKPVLVAILAFFGFSQAYAQKHKPDELDATSVQHQIYIDGAKPSKTFEGFGSISSGGSSRLLYDYPEPYRSDILDYLFKPNFGANIHHLKVEIGGDVNATDGSEPSIAVSREEFEHPKEAYFKRGYEYWLMSEAKKRNPNIIFEGLQWGAPGWIGNGNFFTKDNIDFVCAWVKGAKKYWGLDINYVGVRNEIDYDKEYIKLLRKGLDAQGLQNVTIDAGDLYSDQRWKIADDMMADPELAKAIGVINSHIPEEVNYVTTQNVRKIKKPVWSGESHFYGTNWYSAASWARSYRSYIVGGITKIINWSLISSYHDYLVVPHSGIMVANTPWSGHYDVLASIWALAHINQFAQPGWKYLDSGCKFWSHKGSLYEGPSMVTLKSPDTDDYSIIIETMDAKEPQTFHIKLSEDLSKNNLSVFQTVFMGQEFIKQPDIEVKNKEFLITVQPNSIYSLTTTRGQHKGIAVNKIPASTKEQPLNYYNDFEKQDLNSSALYFMDQHGTFEVVASPTKNGKCLKQVSTMQGICWRCRFDHPLSIMGDINWRDYEFSSSFLIPDSGEVFFVGRDSEPANGTNATTGYGLHIKPNGNWELKIESGKTLASGSIKNALNKWHSFKMIFNSNTIELVIDQKSEAKITDATYKQGVVAIGTGWNEAYFDNIKVTKIDK
ncbi:hypothetical protein I5M32_11710 [Pedobacter sp. SD-b]|uniref:galactosylceramidase n=1 Tax=Pedobacter segetis TaxID=2793069 RepID=A0ABS1BL53_9SPHI|nr:hypothetical protein [Pedobacter segetis]MBK0383624.1 hypothetical protein [Pedobacter segetis]